MEWHDECLEELIESTQKKQQRFEAALKFATSSMLYGDQESGEYRHPTFDEAIEMTDDLIAKLEETST